MMKYNIITSLSHIHINANNTFLLIWAANPLEAKHSMVTPISYQGLYSRSKIWQILVKPRIPASGCYDDCVVLKFDRHLDSAAAELPVKF